ncbi:MAG: HTH domain-containing protein [Bacteroidetes bacterium]|nr:MAG: HTH domain-containing protein [Bacteroidota bacterium]
MAVYVNIEELISGKTIESERIEFKKGWNPGAVYRTICAFANDFSNTGGGYIIVGVQEENGRAVRPVAGIDETRIDAIQREMINLNNLINPVYHPKLSIEEVDGKKIIVIWVPGGPNRPYEVPEEIKSREKKYSYYIRRYGSTVKTSKQEREELITLANQVPFDDRPNIQASLKDISYVLLRDHLRLTRSRLAENLEHLPVADMLEQMELLSGPPEQMYPRNVALMLFSDKPEKYFPYSRVEIVHFPKGEADPEFEEIPAISGPVQYIIANTLSYFKTNVIKERVRKVKGQAEAIRLWNYPYEALEEAIVNALYHRDYQVREPVEIRVYPNSITILNYGGPDRSIKMEAFEKGIVKPRRYRNRRLGDFLKELDLTEGKATGIPLIRKALRENGSPEPVFNTDDDRSFFEVQFLIHGDFEGEIILPSVKLPEVEKQEAVELSESALKILHLMAENPEITIADLADKTGVSTRAVDKNIAKLKRANKIERIGTKQSGIWKIK